MSRYRGYGNSNGARTYLSRREEYALTETEKHEAFLRRKAVDEAARKAAPIVMMGLARPICPPPSDTAAVASVQPVPVQAAPQTSDLFATLDVDDCDEEVAGNAPGM